MIGAVRYFNPRYWAARFWPKVGANEVPAPATGEIAATGARSYIEGTMTVSQVSGSVAVSAIGGSISGSVIGGTIS